MAATASLSAQAASSQTAAAAQVSTPNSVEISDLVLPDKVFDGKTPSISISTRFFETTIDSAGARIVSLKHKDSENNLRNLVELANQPMLFEVYMTPASQDILKNASYELTESESEKTRQLEASIALQARSSDGRLFPVKLVKTYTFYKNIHYFAFSWKIENLSNQNLNFGKLYFVPITSLGPAPAEHDPQAEQTFQAFYHAGEDFKSFSALHGDTGVFSCGESNQESEFVGKKLNYFGMSTRFMLLALQPLSATEGVYVFPGELHAQLAPMLVTAGSQGTLSFLAYAGPKVNEFVKVTPEMLQEAPDLKQLHPELIKAFNFGITAPIRDLIVVILHFLYGFIGNYGLAIILFTLLFKLLFFPLNQKQAQSIEKMKQLQPLMKEINEKYKDNPQEKQKRTLQVYQQHKVNPLGGCLPMLIQIPIFIALYSAFSDAYELWKSPFIPGWINDLSQPDTVYIIKQSLPVIGGIHINILPLIMGVTQILQSRYTVVSEDPNQKLIMQIMPVFLLFIFWSMPSGVVLYWTIFNLLSILQQIYTNKTLQKTA